jgi:hypothetical protein
VGSVITQGKNRRAGVTQNVFGHTAHEQVRKGTAAVCAHYDQVAGVLLGDPADHFAGMAGV